MKKKVLVVVAHPDDETIWMGGTLLINRNKWNTTIISLCRKDDKDRAPKFRKGCKIFKAKCFISDLEDEKLNDIPMSEVIKRIRKHANKKYDYIFTHGKNGEYGHKRHIDVNKAVKEMLKNKMLSCEKIFFFAYKKRKNVCCPRKKLDKFIKLKEIHFKNKRKMIQTVYEFNKKSFEYKSCGEKEAFKLQKII